MADNLTVTPGVGASVAADDVGGILYQRIKLAWGVDGSAVDASASNPLPVTSTVTALPALPAGSNVIGAVTQSGTWNIGSVTTLPALVAGTAIIGKVGIDQTTPGTTNLVAAGQSGTWNITNISGTISLPTGAATATNQSTLNTNIGATTDTAAANGAAGSALAYLRAIKDAATSTASSPVSIDQTTDGTTNRVSAVVRNPSYETVAASQTDQVMGASGAAGDILAQVLIVPATTSPGAVSIKDGAGSAITVFTGGASSVSTLIPFAVPLGLVAGTNWKITTGANVSAIGIGKFS